MSRIDELTDGAEMRDVAYWDAGAAAVSISTSIKRSGAASYFVSAGGFTPPAIKNLPVPAVTHFDRRGCYFTVGSEDVPFLLLYDVAGGLLVYYLWRGSNGLVYAYRGDGVLLGVSAVALLPERWYVVETGTTIDDAAGIAKVRVEKVLLINETGVDTKPGVNGLVYSLGVKTGTATYVYLDDLAGDDADWCGDGAVLRKKGNGNGDVSDFLGSDGDRVDNYLLVDEDVPDGDGTYIESGTPGDQDLVHVEDYTGTGLTVLRAWAEGRARGTGLGEEVKLGVKSGATTSMGPARALMTSYTRVLGAALATNPDTGLGWTDGDLDAVQVGAEVV